MYYLSTVYYRVEVPSAGEVPSAVIRLCWWWADGAITLL